MACRYCRDFDVGDTVNLHISGDKNKRQGVIVNMIAGDETCPGLATVRLKEPITFPGGYPPQECVSADVREFDLVSKACESRGSRSH